MSSPRRRTVVLVATLALASACAACWFTWPLTLPPDLPALAREIFSPAPAPPTSSGAKEDAPTPVPLPKAMPGRGGKRAA